MKIIKSIIALAIFLPGLVLAANLSYIPRVYLDGYTGTTNLLGKADILAPLYLTANNNLFAYAQGKCGHEDKNWEDNSVQFPRLLAAINATQENLDESALADDMNITIPELDELFDRADDEWERIKVELL